MYKRILFIVIVFVFSVSSCGKKGPLKPPVLSITGVREASFLVSDDRILINAIMDFDVDFFRIERVELDTFKRPISQKVIYEGIENKVSFIDKNLDREKFYQYKITPYLKNKKIGKIYISSPIGFKVITPPYNLKGDIIETKGTVTLYFDGDQCDSFNIYRYKNGEKRSTKPLSNVKEKYYVDEMPIYGIDMIYEVSCVVDGQESENNPKINVLIK